MIKTISLDIETYSSVEIGRSGVYRYAEADDFDILLLSYSIDGGEIETIDLAMGEKIPEEILEALASDTVHHWAYNSSFERICLSVWLRRNRPDLFKGYGKEDESTQNYLSPSSWYCDMVLSAYSGLPLSLKGVGTVLALDEQKDECGKTLIKYFCSPCTPTKSNGGRTRNYWYHDKDKWEAFKKYNAQDVRTEMAIHNKLEPKYSVPDFVWNEYHMSETINDRGIRVDMDLVRNAIALDRTTRDDILQKLSSLTLLDNPNSVPQMKTWLKENGIEAEKLGKKDVQALLKNEELPPDIQKALGLRLQVSKSSIKKYEAMENCVCSDGRVHGMFMFYGANRTGRFSGRLVQLQNLPQNHIEDLENARNLVKLGDSSVLKAIYDDVPDTLSQLIRTAFIPRNGYKFIVADYSAIEARVIAYLAHEQWRLDAFARGDDIYCAAASQMFKVPVVKHGINGELRQKGKISELACIAEHQLVLTDKGLVPIEEVTQKDRLWDGEEWVEHDGVIYKGEREVITYEGLTATENHLVYVEGRSEPVRFEDAVRDGLQLIKTGDSVPEYKVASQGPAKVYDILNAGRHHRFTVSGHLVHNCGYGGGVGALKSMGALELGLKEEELQPLVTSWREANPNIVQFWWDVDAAVKTAIRERSYTESHGIYFEYKSGMLFITLPSGRHLSYVKPRLEMNQHGTESITYEGVGLQKKWERLESYGPKFVENCIAEGTLVITDKGVVPIEKITEEMAIWDGEEFVHHDGLIYQGMKKVISVNGVYMTSDHKILTDKGWKKSAETEGLNWAAVSLPDCFKESGEHFAGKAAVALSLCMRKGNRSVFKASEGQKEASEVMRMHEAQTDKRIKKDTRNVPSSGMGSVAQYETEMHRAESPRLEKLRRPWNKGLRQVARKLRELLGRHGAYLAEGTGTGPHRQQRELLSGELPLDNEKGKLQKQKNLNIHNDSILASTTLQSVRAQRNRRNNSVISDGTSLACRVSVPSAELQKPVYDVRNCGPRHRFAVWNGERALIVSNCVQAISRDVLCAAMIRLQKAGISTVAHIHDETVNEAPLGMTVDEVAGIMSITPDWMKDINLTAAGYECNFYMKD